MITVQPLFVKFWVIQSEKVINDSGYSTFSNDSIQSVLLPCIGISVPVLSLNSNENVPVTAPVAVSVWLMITVRLPFVYRSIFGLMTDLVNDLIFSRGMFIPHSAPYNETVRSSETLIVDIQSKSGTDDDLTVWEKQKRTSENIHFSLTNSWS